VLFQWIWSVQTIVAVMLPWLAMCDKDYGCSEDMEAYDL
jgi:hypothetical protein